MSNLKKDIERAVEQAVDIAVILGRAIERGERGVKDGYKEIHQEKDDAIEIIINLIESVIPEEKKDDIPGVIFNQAGIAYFDGWNECIADIKSKLIGKE